MIARSALAVFVALSVLAVAGCDQAKRQAQEKVAAGLRDPSSAQFQKVEVRKSGAVCGEVNGRNGYGGYVGFKQFVVTPAGEVSIDPDDPAPVVPGQAPTVEQIQAAGDAYGWIATHTNWCVIAD